MSDHLGLGLSHQDWYAAESRLRDILAASHLCAHITSKGEPAFFDPGPAGAILRAAAHKQIEIMGEASGALPSAVRGALPQVEWRQLIAMRNRLSHDYPNADHLIVWRVITARAAHIAAQIRAFLAE